MEMTEEQKSALEQCFKVILNSNPYEAVEIRSVLDDYGGRVCLGLGSLDDRPWWEVEPDFCRVLTSAFRFSLITSDGLWRRITGILWSLGTAVQFVLDGSVPDTLIWGARPQDYKPIPSPSWDDPLQLEYVERGCSREEVREIRYCTLAGVAIITTAHFYALSASQRLKPLVTGVDFWAPASQVSEVCYLSPEGGTPKLGYTLYVADAATRWAADGNLLLDVSAGILPLHLPEGVTADEVRANPLMWGLRKSWARQSGYEAGPWDNLYIHSSTDSVVLFDHERVENSVPLSLVSLCHVKRNPGFYSLFMVDGHARLCYLPSRLPYGWVEVHEYSPRYQEYFATYFRAAQCSRCGAPVAEVRLEEHTLECRRRYTMDAVQGYHARSSSRIRVYPRNRNDYSRPESSYTIGFEVEKNHVMNSDGSTAHEPGDYVDRSPLFSRWERDGSCGVEGITHAYPLSRYRLFSSHVREAGHLLASPCDGMRGPRGEDEGQSRFSCGGHITLNGPNVSMNSVRRYAGLVYALYKKRLRNYYCSDNKDMQGSGRDIHYCAIRERGYDSVEFRLVRRVEHADNLRWRFRLFRVLARSLANGVPFEEFLNAAKPVLREVYKKDRLKRVLADARAFDNYLNRGIVHSSIAEYIQ